MTSLGTAPDALKHTLQSSNSTIDYQKENKRLRSILNTQEKEINDLKSHNSSFSKELDNSLRNVASLASQVDCLKTELASLAGRSVVSGSGLDSSEGIRNELESIKKHKSELISREYLLKTLLGEVESRQSSGEMAGEEQDVSTANVDNAIQDLLRRIARRGEK
ncbi:uncharacterized protein I206_106522 [Kwoniella pini CBS 10737]|uniref:Uncharacterized protein n=1 Tax=Kwoniella pini CBS 10737 TaxID=1296096 RepID=A0A1B9HS81_9TREE|nr:uncharacterized protein I206_07909 [Kwoniella pini CBS 10737]OCF46124.1 hypothetical protein I206_07909 [Kwoniella pini CBS 10737]